MLRLAGNKTKENLSNSENKIENLEKENEILKDEKIILADQLKKLQGQNQNRTYIVYII